MRNLKIFSDINMFWDHSISDETYRKHINEINLQNRIEKEISNEIEYEKYL
jgi:hypothetical protein